MEVLKACVTPLEQTGMLTRVMDNIMDDVGYMMEVAATNFH